MNFSDKSELTPKTVSRRTEAPRGGVLRKAGELGGAAVLMMASSGAFALPTGTDVNLSMKPASGGMAGAAYTKPQDASAAVFGNPATMTQFSGTNFGIGAAYLAPNLEVTQSGAAGTRTSKSGAEDYAAPDVAVTHELGDGWHLGTGIEVDAGLGADFRNSPITVPGASADPAITGLPLLVELLSFNINIGAAKKLTPQTSVGATLTIGFGMAQLGTAGPSGAAFGGFGGTTSSVHDFGFGGSLGVTHQLTQALMLSAAIKSPVKYDFKNILYTTVGTPGFQNLSVEQPLELVFGGAYDIAPNWMVETDLVWKNWSKAATYQDVYNDQFLLSVGTQYKTGPWSLRMGYSYAEDILRNTPNSTLGGLRGLGPAPLNVELVKLVQTTLVPVVWNHTLTAGVGFDFTRNVRLDTFAAYAFKGDASRTTNVSGAGPETYKADVNAWAVGLGLNYKF
ncbi:OmpP1/FadL family transporter [Rhodoferax ferrireducens]|uniref:OmpP1/FadL family transporter n=1 Tax=Rhodoferax ferrireducens TaxID=192843 RepID=UPI000E0D08C4|nr:outer membrane protein transport protein [Rhodoferax ferrireducens]